MNVKPYLDVMNYDGIQVALLEILHLGQDLLAYVTVTAMRIRLGRMGRLVLGLERQIKESFILPSVMNF